MTKGSTKFSYICVKTLGLFNTAYNLRQSNSGATETSSNSKNNFFLVFFFRTLKYFEDYVTRVLRETDLYLKKSNLFLKFIFNYLCKIVLLNYF